MLTLIDGDIVQYRCSWASNNDPLGIAIARTDEMIDLILHDTGADSFEIYLSDDHTNNFRYQIDPSYKANRKDVARPVWYREIKDHLFNKWNAELSLGMEADDSLGIRQTEELRAFDPDSSYWDQPKFTTSVICSIDKDLKQIPGNHYNFVKKEASTVFVIDGIRQLYLQLLIGDTSDNVKGVDHIGPVKAGKLLNHIGNEYDMFEIVRDLYNNDERLLKNGRLLYIRREDNEIWNFPSKQVKRMLPEGGHGPSSTQPMPRVIIPSTELIGAGMVGTS